MEDPDREGGESLSKESGKNDGGASSCPCPPEFFAACWDRELGPFRRKPFRDDNDLVGELIRQEESLLAYAARCPIADETWSELRRHRVAGGAEHEVFVPDRLRVWKQTKPNRWGFKKDTPMDYLWRLQELTNYAQPLKILVEGILVVGNVPSIVTSMTYVEGRHPLPQELAAKLGRDGWKLIPDPTGLMAYQHMPSGTIIRDAHPGNFIVAAQGLYVPIDVAIEGAP